MKFFYLSLLLFFSFCSYAQPTFPSYDANKKPNSVIRNKFYKPLSAFATQSNHTEIEKCATTEVNEVLRKKYNLPSVEEYENTFKGLQKEYLEERAKRRTNSSVITIPVIVHIVHNGESIGAGANISQAQVQSQIDVLNEDFRRKPNTPGYNEHPAGADVGIEFALALRDEKGNTLEEPGIHRIDGSREFWTITSSTEELMPSTIWDTKRYLNMWVVNFGGVNNDLLGFAQFPNLSGLEGVDDNMGPSSTDGVVMRYDAFGRVGNVSAPADGGRTTTHEIGHWLGLRHIWGDGDCSIDDFCEDTPKAGAPNYGCKIGNNSCGSWPFDDGPDMIENYMDYSDDACMNIFTQDQKTRMLTVMENSPRRKELKNSTVHLNLERPIAFITSDRQQVCTGESIQFTDNSINEPTSRQWIFTDSEGNLAGYFEDANPTILINSEGVYDLTFIVANNKGSDTIYLPEYLSVLSSELLQFPYQESFESEISLQGWQIYNPDNDRTWQLANVNSSEIGTTALWFDNYSDIDGDPTGTEDMLLSPSIDLSSNTYAFLNFDLAYAPYGGEYADTLAVFATTDCGQSFELLWYRGGDEMATDFAAQESFIPSGPSKWQKVNIPLQGLNGFSNVHLAIVNYSGWGNNLFIDNLEILQPDYSTGSFTNFTTISDTISVGSSINFYDASEDYPLAWSWFFEGGSPSTSDLQNPTVTYNTTGTFDVTLATANFANIDDPDVWSVPDRITVVDKPQVAVSTSSGNTSVCLGDSIILRATGANSYKWYDSRGSLASEADSIKVFPQISTNYRVTGFDRYGGEADANIVLTVNETPSFDLGADAITSIQKSLSIDVGQSFASYLWSDGSEERSVSIEGSSYGEGTHQIYVTATDQNGCAFTDTMSVTFMPSPVAKIETSTSSNDLCKGDKITLTAEGGDSFEWKDKDGNLLSDEANLEISPTNNTNYSLTVFDQYGGQDSEDISVTVNELPVFNLGEDISMTSEESVTLDVGATFESYEWKDGSSAKTLEVLGSDYGVGNHEIYVKVIDGNNCIGSDTINITISEPLGLFETTFSDIGVKVYPIPSSDEVIVELDELKKGIEIKIYDTKGKMLYSREIRGIKNKIDISSYSKGLYFFNIKKGMEQRTIKVVKE